MKTIKKKPYGFVMVFVCVVVNMVFVMVFMVILWFLLCFFYGFCFVLLIIFVEYALVLIMVIWSHDTYMDHGSAQQVSNGFFMVFLWFLRRFICAARYSSIQALLTAPNDYKNLKKQYTCNKTPNPP